MKYAGNLFENVENCKLWKKNIARSWTPHIPFHSHNDLIHLQKLLKTELQQPLY
jgi:hypothetical protein